MPEMDGLELLISLRGQGNPVTFGFVTTEGTDEMRQRAAAAGASFLIAKPFTADTFREVLSPVLA
jgi:two-component system chemotaxis response regulator CheY